MIFVLLGFVGFGLYFIIKGDGPAKLVGVLLILLALFFFGMFWIAFNIHLPPTGAAIQPATEVHHV